MAVVVWTARGIALVRPTVTQQVSSRWLAARLDQELVRGRPPESDVRLATRAAYLVRPRTRAFLARSLGRILDCAPDGPRWPAVGVHHGAAGLALAPSRRRVVQEVAAELSAVVASLRRPGPMSCQGIARVCLLLSDGAGVLYTGSSGELRRCLTEIVEELDRWRLTEP